MRTHQHILPISFSISLISSAFSEVSRHETLYDPEAVKDADAVIKVIQSNDKPMYRAAQDDTIMEWAKMGTIPPLVALKAMSMPQAKEIVAMMEQAQQEQMAAQQQQQGMPPQ